MKTLTKIKRFIQSEDAATAVEYALLLSLVAVVCLTALSALGSTTAGVFQEASDQMGARLTP
jgi:pilus assembly protein Flp/PilA